ncbi:hypothetical protein K474DRAFT_1704606 [Panus rudis PR-1116 ss-1]|nr:hypothetical protein K474DRAFT_1704606 [Panus rudis PR-1116 ss-1]
MTSEFVEQSLNEDHPLLLELNSLRTAVERYQHEAHSAAVKLQRHSLDTSHALERAHLLETENVRLKEEVEILRANPDVTPHPAALQVPELTLALRKLSDKLTFTEEALLSRTTELATANVALATAKHELDAAHQLVAQAKAKEQEAMQRERELELKARAAEEERRMTDLVVQEYADLVRSLEGRAKSPTKSALSPTTTEASASSATLVEGLAEGKTGLHRLLGEFNGESERLASNIHRLQAEIEALSSTLDSERKSAEETRNQLAEALAQLDKYKADDNTAARMVSRYMKFSQSTIDSLQKAMDTLKTRHASTGATLHAQIDTLQRALHSEQRETETLRRALDELSEDISRESYGRRREIALRLAFLSREESLAESLRRWIRKFKEVVHRASSSPQDDAEQQLRKACDGILQEAEGLLEILNGQPSLVEDTPGSLARVLAAKEAVAGLTQELQNETNRRLRAELQLANASGFTEHGVEVPRSNGIEQQPGLQLTKIEPITSRSDQAVSPVVASPDTAGRIERSASSSSTLSTSSQASEPLVSPISPAQLDIRQLPDEGPLLSSGDTEVAPDNTPEVSLVVTPPAEEKAPEATSDIEPAQDKSIIDAEDTPIVKQHSLLPTDDALVSADEPADAVKPTKAIPDIVVADVDLQQTEHHTIEPIRENESPAAASPADEADIKGDGVQEVMTNNAVEEGHSSPKDQYPTPIIPPLQLSAPPSPNAESNPAPSPSTLLTQLATVKGRYDQLQRAFRECHTALRDLKKDLSTLPQTHQTTYVLQTAVERLDDHSEDTRVELEIRVADEERVYLGYETLLSIPGAIQQSGEDESDGVDRAQLEEDIRAFIDGSDPTVHKAMGQFTHKLDDLQHDIACVKRALHEFASSVEEDAMSQAESPASGRSPSWSSWTGGLIGGASPSRTSSPAPTFGSVMTSPRLRPSNSLSNMRRKPSSSHEALSPTGADPFGSLGLKIPMPTHLISRPSPLSAGAGGRPAVRPRTTSASAMYMLGIGGRSTSFSGGALPATPPRRSPAPVSSPSPVQEKAKSMTAKEETSDEESTTGDVDSDVE